MAALLAANDACLFVYASPFSRSLNSARSDTSLAPQFGGPHVRLRSARPHRALTLPEILFGYRA